MAGRKTKPVVLSELEKTLLSLLYQRRLYALQFINLIKEASDGEREVGIGSLYPTLGRMENKGFVDCKWGDESSGPRRKYYDITPYGKSLLEKDWRFHEKLNKLLVDAESQATTDSGDSETPQNALTTLKKS